MKTIIEKKKAEIVQQERALALDISELTERLERLRADRAACNGAIQVCDLLLKEGALDT
jgi:hypothetical protein